ncbi:MAG: NUDIX domain-containing protein, partial [Rhodospirillales bacterium]|nr:NUDIX domain-containing protein [Rhodospirillales bacterium]
MKGEPVSIAAPETGFLRHVLACHTAVLPGERVPFRIGAAQVGWVQPALADRLAHMDGVGRSADGVGLPDGDALPDLARSLAKEGWFRWRSEAFDVRADPDGPVLAQIDRGAVPAFGVFAVGVHVNGLVRRADGLHLWVARRARDKLLDPGKLDHIVAGGVPAGLTPAETLVKEAAEEAAIPPALARSARQVGVIGYAMERAEGLRRDHLHCYDLDLPEDFVPQAADGEVEGFELWPVMRAVEMVRDTNDFKFNVNLVLIDLFLRHRLIEGEAARTLRTALNQGG